MLELTYSCERCGILQRVVRVPYREARQDVIRWMKEVVEVALIQDHREHSPGCTPETLTDVKIPIPPGTEWVGGPVMN